MTFQIMIDWIGMSVMLAGGLAIVALFLSIAIRLAQESWKNAISARWAIDAYEYYRKHEPEKCRMMQRAIGHTED